MTRSPVCPRRRRPTPRAVVRRSFGRRSGRRVALLPVFHCRVFHCLVLCLVLLGLPSLLAPAPADARTSRDVDRRVHLDAVRGQLELGEWKEAAERIRRAEKEILHESRPLRDDDRHLAELALYRAVVAANLGERDEAEWYWYVALNLHEPTAYRDVSAWGEAAAVLGAVEVRELGREPEGVEVFWPYPGRDFEEPKMPSIRSPDSLQSSHEIDKVKSVQVEIFLDEQGVPRSPRRMGRLQLPILFYSYAQQIFEKKWKPARSEGEPVPMLVEITQVVKSSRW